MTQPPLQEPRAAGLGTDRLVAEAVHELRDRPDRDPETGRFVDGNTAAGRTLERSEAFWSVVAEAKADLVERLRSDLAVNGDAAVTLEGLVDAYAEARLLRHSMFTRLVELGGPVTTKGKSRSLFTGYLAVLDREVRLATTLGLERRARRVPTTSEYLRGQGEAT